MSRPDFLSNPITGRPLTPRYTSEYLPPYIFEDTSEEPSPEYTSPIVINTTTLRDIVRSTPNNVYTRPVPRHSYQRFLKSAAVAMLSLFAIIGLTVGCSLSGRRAYPRYSPLNYTLLDAYEGPSFFDHFTFFSDEPDPTNGFVEYVDRDSAADLNLTSITADGSIVLRVDTSDPAALLGRKSVRIESTKTYDQGLFLFDVLHSPYGCGTWPALWLTDPVNWPANGEIDVMEASNLAESGNEVTLHAEKGCSMKGKRKQTGFAASSSCDDSGSEGVNTGCGVEAGPGSFGRAFNEIGGGIYALEIQHDGIRIWFFPRHAIPSDIINESPDPLTWGEPLADFPGTHCDIPSHFSNQRIIANIDLCGEMGGLDQLYKDMSHCPDDCESFVARNPEGLQLAYWEFGGFWIYRQ